MGKLSIFKKTSCKKILSLKKSKCSNRAHLWSSPLSSLTHLIMIAPIWKILTFWPTLMLVVSRNSTCHVCKWHVFVKKWIYFYGCPCLDLKFFSFNHLPTIVVNENHVRILGSRHMWKRWRNFIKKYNIRMWFKEGDFLNL